MFTKLARQSLLFVNLFPFAIQAFLIESDTLRKIDYLKITFGNKGNTDKTLNNASFCLALGDKRGEIYDAVLVPESTLQGKWRGYFKSKGELRLITDNSGVEPAQLVFRYCVSDPSGALIMEIQIQGDQTASPRCTARVRCLNYNLANVNFNKILWQLDAVPAPDNTELIGNAKVTDIVWLKNTEKSSANVTNQNVPVNTALQVN